jgi:hypothetical protein
MKFKNIIFPIILVLVFVVLSMQVSALGLAPARKIIDFKPGLTSASYGLRYKKKSDQSWYPSSTTYIPYEAVVALEGDSYYIDFDLEHDNCLKIQSSRNIKYTVRKYKNGKNSFYFNQIIPYEYTIKFFKANE